MPSRELIIFPGALGDLICLIPAISEIIRRAAGNPVELMARHELARFAVDRIGIARAHSIDRPEVGELFTPEGADFQSVRAFFSNFGRIQCFFASGDAQFRRSLAAIVPQSNFYRFRPAGEGHVSAAYLHEIGADPGELSRRRLKILASDRASAEQVIGQLGLHPREFLLIFPGSGSPRKNWSVENFVRLAEGLTSRLRPLVVIGPAEAEIENFFHRTRISTVSEQELGVVAGLASMAKLFVGNDSGVSHLAAASGARGVALFGPTDPARWHPLGEVEILRCEPMAELTVDEVMARLVRLIQNETVEGNSAQQRE